MQINGEKIYLKRLNVEDVTANYVTWMSDPEVCKYLESKWQSHTLESIRKYVDGLSKSPSNYLMGIFNITDNKHIGNIKLGNIHKVHRYCDLGLLIGEKEFWGKGIATEAITSATKYGFEILNLHKIFATVWEPNVGSYKAFIKAGYVEVGIFKKHIFLDGKYVDEYILEIINNNETHNKSL